MFSLLYKKGAEAYLYKEEWYGRTILKKIRIPKAYRHSTLDIQLRMARTIHEAKIMTDTRKLGISTPIIYHLNVPQAAIYMEFIEGTRIKELLHQPEIKLQNICEKIGTLIAILHENNIIHGDLTTSNMILQNVSEKIYLIDFGLSEYSTAIESRGVDLHLIHRALQSTHFNTLDTCFSSIKKGYSSVIGTEKSDEIFQRLEEIEKRGRYH